MGLLQKTRTQSGFLRECSGNIELHLAAKSLKYRFPSTVPGLRETVLLESGIVLWRVAKITDFLATFQVHPWTDLTSHEPLRQKTEWLGKLVREPLCGSQRLMSDHRKRPKPYTLNHWVVGSIPTRCSAEQERLTYMFT